MGIHNVSYDGDFVGIGFLVHQPDTVEFEQLSRYVRDGLHPKDITSKKIVPHWKADPRPTDAVVADCLVVTLGDRTYTVQLHDVARFVALAVGKEFVNGDYSYVVYD